jgi:hypothetical protein
LPADRRLIGLALALVLGLGAASRPAQAQPAVKLRTIGFMGSSSITVTNVNFATNATGTDELNYIVLTLKNTGTKTVTIAAIRINNQVISDMLANSTTVTPAESSLVWINPAADVPGMAMNAGNTATLTLSTRNMLAQWVNGNPYKIDLYDGSNQVIGSAQQNAPGA